MKLMTYNIQNDYKLFNNEYIKNKARDIVSLIKNYDLDVIGFQELSTHQCKLYKDLLKEYSFIGDHRHSGFLSNEYNCIFIKKGIDIISYKTCKLNDKKLDGQKFLRICTLVKLTFENKVYLVVNTHLDNSNDEVRKKELDYLKHIIKEEKNYDYVIIMGDFNMNENKYLKEFAKDLKMKNCTIHLENTYRGKNWILDHVYISNTLKCDYKEKPLIESSDHYPLIVSVSNK